MTRIDWVVFGDDWGRLPSTTQHLFRRLPDADRIVWVDSIGMRTPTLRADDLRRIWGKLLAMGGAPPDQLDPRRPPTWRFQNVRPKVLPAHEEHAARAFNRWSLTRELARRFAVLGVREPVLVCSNPLGWLYRGAVERAMRSMGSDARLPAVYLRLDAYDVFPGVEPGLVHRVEPDLIANADHVFATATTLVPPSREASSTYLPQGVDLAQFSRVPLDPPRGRVVGYYGNVASWLDQELIEAVVRSHPDWTFEFIGPVRVPFDRIQALPNTRFLGPCPYPDLPEATAHWDGAWMPFVIDDHIRAANPLKMREYLAAGFPIACTDFPEAHRAGAPLGIIDDVASFARWIRDDVRRDERTRRSARRDAVRPHTWAARATRFRETVSRTVLGRSA